MPKFTETQLNAIEASSKTLLVSAAAGSGKTTTLIERIMRSIMCEENPVMLDRLLVVTFTKASADDLSMKISKAISKAIEKNGKSDILAKQFSLLQSAKFCTIDSYFLSLVRSNYAALGISPNFRMGDAGETTLLELGAMNDLVNYCFDSDEGTIAGGKRGFAALVDLLVGSASDKTLPPLLLKLYEKLAVFPEGAAALFDWEKKLRSYANEDYFKSPYGKIIEEHLLSFFDYYKKAYTDIIQSILPHDEKLVKLYLSSFEDDLSQIRGVLKALDGGYASGCEAISKISFSTLGQYRGDKSSAAVLAKEFRDKYKSDLSGLIKNFLYADTKEISECICKTADVCHSLGELLCEFERRVSADKKRLSVYSFTDITRFALKLLVDENGNDTPFALSQKALYDAVYIDEYQDVNAVQNRIFEAVSTESNRFMVGDIKQSIYSFRGAAPTIFSSLRSSFPPFDKNDGLNKGSLFMSENFRCNKEVVAFTNMIFDKFMPLMCKESNYCKEDALVFSKECTSEQTLPVNVVVTEAPPKASVYGNVHTEAEYIAKEIKRLVKEEKKDDGTPITYGDIAILLRTAKGKIEDYSNALLSAGIPVFAQTNEALLDRPEVKIVLCLLSAIDNPRRDTALAGVIFSPLCGISYDLVTTLRKKNKHERLYDTLKRYAEGDSPQCSDKARLCKFFEELADLRKMARFMNAGDLVDEIYDTYGIYATLSASDKLRRTNLELFRNFACERPLSLGELLRTIRQLEETPDLKMTAASPDFDAGGAVQIITIHKSKGLEYPVVFLANALKKHNYKDGDASPLYSSKHGLALKLRDDSGFGLYDTPLRRAIGHSVKLDTNEDELRMLYVALTRARERLYVTAMSAKALPLLEKAKFESRVITQYSASKTSSYMELILAACGCEDNEFTKLSVIPFTPLKAESVVATEEAKPCEKELDSKEVEALNKRFAYKYPHTARTKIPAKLSVSRLYPDILDDTLPEGSIDEKKLPMVKDAPRFISESENDGAKRGTATHLFMQFFDFEFASQNGAEKELERLVQKCFLTKEDAALVNLDEVNAFLSSQLFEKMRKAKRLYREQRFNLTLNASDFAKDEGLKAELSGETVLVQGVIDCFFFDEEDNIVLVDYKTDRVSKSNPQKATEQLLFAHREQLSYYARAVAEICGKMPSQSIIYSLCLGQCIDV